MCVENSRIWIAPEVIGVMAAKRTLRKLGGRAVPTQTVPVVLEPNMARDLLGDIFNAASGESIFRKASFLVGQLGESVANKRLTVIDDGAMPRGLGSRPFDGEGLPTRRTVVIRNGFSRVICSTPTPRASWVSIDGQRRTRFDRGDWSRGRQLIYRARAIFAG